MWSTRRHTDYTNRLCGPVTNTVSYVPVVYDKRGKERLTVGIRWDVHSSFRLADFGSGQSQVKIHVVELALFELFCISVVRRKMCSCCRLRERENAEFPTFERASLSSTTMKKGRWLHSLTRYSALSPRSVQRPVHHIHARTVDVPNRLTERAQVDVVQLTPVFCQSFKTFSCSE